MNKRDNAVQRIGYLTYIARDNLCAQSYRASSLLKQNNEMGRIKELVRLATLEQHFQDGLVEVVEVLTIGGLWSVRVRYKDKAEGEKTRFLTSYRTPGARRFVSLATVWKVLEAHGIDDIVVRKAAPEDRIP